jgi:hypothetical protein
MADPTFTCEWEAEDTADSTSEGWYGTTARPISFKLESDILMIGHSSYVVLCCLQLRCT